jgi:hypothetical protein
MNSDIKEQISKTSGNNTCFDCDIANPDWVSINNAILLCKDCQLKHRSYGVSVSYIRSIQLDMWKEDQIALIKLGGNQRLKDLMSVYNIKSSIDRYELFYSKLLDYYRKLLRAELKGDIRPHPPSDEEALMSIDNSKTNVVTSESKKVRIESSNNYNDLNDNMNIEDENSNSSKEATNSGFTGYLSSIWGQSKDIASNLKNKVDETGITEKVKANTSYVYSKVKDSASQIGQYSQVVIEKGTELAHTGIEKTKEKYQEIVSPNSNFYNTY